ncbi:hypothetical protein DFH94DRAFT_232400 [Russula ochroleuca]|uniref:Uncharacterized protein n=1 Tax=Russula ochroleuca TaxID=152965 RepID=A0A9P5JX16_9AGAM|nr:hypothetical protein DFH94DRAFT_232400 [Russula ochroleuca]
MGSRASSKSSTSCTPSSSQGNEATDYTCSTCVVRSSESVSGNYDSSFHRVHCLSPDSPDLIYLFILRIGRNRYSRSHWSSLVFADQPLQSLVDTIHIDLVEIWNYCMTGTELVLSSPQLPSVLNAQRSQYLSSNHFNINMSHVVKDRLAPSGGAS